MIVQCRHMQRHMRGNPQWMFRRVFQGADKVSFFHLPVPYIVREMQFCLESALDHKRRAT